MSTSAEPLALEYFEQPALLVAEALVQRQACLCRRTAPGEVTRLPVVEAEAYTGPEDGACHAYRGETPRNRVMFGVPGRWYVYLCYGVHWLLNIVVERRGHPAAVLIRGVGKVYGPGRITRMMGIDGRLNDLPAQPASGLWLEWSTEPALPKDQVVATPRIGIDGAGKEWALKPYRFVTGPEAKKPVRSQWLPR